jgi:hypothetical protein
VFGDKFCRYLDIGALDTDTSFSAITCETRTTVGCRGGRRDNDCVVADEGESVLTNRELLGIGAGFDNDLILSICRVYSCLDRLGALT